MKFGWYVPSLAVPGLPVLSQPHHDLALGVWAERRGQISFLLSPQLVSLLFLPTKWSPSHATAVSLANIITGAQGQEKEVSTCPGEVRGNGGFRGEKKEHMFGGFTLLKAVLTFVFLYKKCW